MCLSNEQERARRIILKNQLKSARDAEAQQRFRETLLKRRKRIEQLQADAVPNLIYVFPRHPHHSDSESSLSSQEWDNNSEEWALYDLKAQNRKDKNYQTQTQTLNHARCASSGDGIGLRADSGPRQLIRSLLKGKQDSERAYFSRKPKDQKSGKKEEVNLSNYNSRKGRDDLINLSSYNSRKGDKTALNSSKKLLVEQYSLASHHAKTKKGSQAMTLTCRRKQPPRSRLATEHT